LRDLDIIVCDIQDIGVRYYTYSWTLTHIMDVAAAAGTQIMVLDRPNPLGGENVSGLSLDPELASLVGRYPIPICHGLTLGELATLVNDLWITGDVDLVVVQCDGWQRKMRWADTRLNWIPTSPNMPHIETVLHYPGACLIEGTNLSEGRGTALPFEIVGAPFIADDWLANELNAHDWHGVKFRPCAFHPYRSKWQDIECRGVQAHITDVDKYEPIRVWLDVIQTIRHAYPDDFAWNISHFDRLIGNREVRTMIDRGGDVRKLNWHDDLQQFRELCRPCLLYD